MSGTSSVALDLGRASPKPLGTGGAARGEQRGPLSPSDVSGTACEELLRNCSCGRSVNNDFVILSLSEVSASN